MTQGEKIEDFLSLARMTQGEKIKDCSFLMQGWKKSFRDENVFSQFEDTFAKEYEG